MKQIHDFWEWFITVSDRLMAAPEDEALIRQLDERVREIHRGLTWEICPGGFRPRQFTISPNLDPELRQTAREIIHAAPVLAHWEFYPTRQPREWAYKIQIDNHKGQPIELDVSDWVFLLVHCFHGKQAVLLSSKTMPPLNENQRRQAATDVLCSLLGEDVVMDRIEDFEFGCGFQSSIAEWTSIRLLDAAIQNLQL
ncbi:MAG TPA: hypothetical protein VFK06_17925 [Candidatus Angelobacter sp.]|nr:hypothetical protein [Candidatus Angelobacter sp.]